MSTLKPKEARTQGDYTKLFDHESIQDVFIDIDENDWNYMLQNAMDKPTVLTNSVTIGDQTISYCRHQNQRESHSFLRLEFGQRPL